MIKSVIVYRSGRGESVVVVRSLEENGLKGCPKSVQMWVPIEEWNW